MTPELLAVGRIGRPHGIRGEVNVEPLSEVEARFQPGSVLRLERGGTLTVASARRHQRRLLVKFEEIADRTAAETFRGQVLVIPVDQAPAPPQGAFWVHDVVGLEVVTEGGRSLGRVLEVEANPANDVWITDAGALIPAVRDVVVLVDVAAGRVTVRDLPGLVPSDD